MANQNKKCPRNLSCFWQEFDESLKLDELRRHASYEILTAKNVNLQERKITHLYEVLREIHTLKISYLEFNCMSLKMEGWLDK